MTLNAKCTCQKYETQPKDDLHYNTKSKLNDKYSLGFFILKMKALVFVLSFWQ